MKEFVRLFHF